MLNEIRFVQLTRSGDREIGRARLTPSGRARLIGLPKRIADDLRAHGALNASRRRMWPEDGLKFLRACVHQFSGTYVRAQVVKHRL